MTRSLLCPLLLLLSACASVDGRPPDAAVISDTAVMPAAWSDTVRAVEANTAEGFFAGFDDPDLLALVRASVASTPSIREAQSRIRQARAGVSLAEARRRPTLGLGGNVTRQRTSEAGDPFQQAFGGNDSQGGNQGGGPDIAIPLEQTTYALNATAAWEPDVWGRDAWRVESAALRVEAAQAAAAGVALSLQSETARTYLSLRSVQESLDLIDANLQLLRDNLDLTRLLEDQALASEFDRVQVEADIAALLAQRESLESQAITLGYALSVLTAQAPQSLDQLLVEADASLPDFRGGVEAGLPSTLLLRRPDLRRARAELLAARADIEAAELNRLPSFSLTGEGGLLSLTLESLISEEARRGLLSAAFNWPVFQGGRLEAERALERADESVEVAQYDRAILEALSDVETAFEQYVSAGRRVRQLEDAVAKRARVLELAELRYRSGLDDQFRVLSARRNLLTAQDAQLAARSDRAAALVRIHAALGGDW